MPNPLLVGVDVHRQTNTVCLMDQAGQVLGPRHTIANNRPGAQALVHHLAEKMAEGDFDAIQIAAEATGWYWWHFFQSLSRDPTLQQWPLQLYALNPRLTANFAKTYVDRDHTDPNDAIVHADRLRMGRDLPPPYQLDARYLAVRLLTRYRFHVIPAVAREKAYALAEGLSVAAASRVFGHRPATLTSWLTRAGTHSVLVHERFFQRLHLAHLQLDELRTRLGTRTHVLWLWLALDPLTKIIPVLHHLEGTGRADPGLGPCGGSRTARAAGVRLPPRVRE